MITIEYDQSVVSDDEIKALSEATLKIVMDSTGMDDHFVYANAAKVVVNVAPIEILIQMSANKIPNSSDLSKKIRDSLSAWKKQNNFAQPINMMLIPMQWEVELDI